MDSQRTSPLIDATAKLDPADRALLDLWLSRGLEDQRIAELTGTSVGALGSRRARLIAQLSDDLGLATDAVQEMLAAIAGAARQSSKSSKSISGNGSSEDHQNGYAPAAAPAVKRPGLLLGPAAVAAPAGLLLGPGALHGSRRPATPAAATPDPAIAPHGRGPAAGRDRGRRAIALAGGLVALAVLVVGLILLVSAGGGGRHRASAHTRGVGGASASQAGQTPASGQAQPPTATAPNPTSPSTPTPAGQGKPSRPGTPGSHSASIQALADLPGGLIHAHGTVRMVGPTQDLRLELRVSNLPPPRRGHYEVFLYNSVLDSRSLGRLRPRARVDVYALPAQARRYRWIDVSFQPRGYVNHSGESELRASNPAHVTPAAPPRAATRKSHESRRTAKRSSTERKSK